MGRDTVTELQSRQGGSASYSHSSTVTMVMTLTLTLTFTLTLHSAVAQGNDNCQLIPVRENIIKETTVLHLNRQVQASCSAEVDLHKCEGQCDSKVIPSVRHARGFRRDCRCCKEGTIRTRTVPLTRCFHNGELLVGVVDTTEVSDLESCSCSSCMN